MLSRCLFIGLLVLAQASYAWAQEQAISPTPPTTVAAPFTVEEAVRGALQGNSRLDAALRRVRAADVGARLARPLSNPSFTIAPALTSLSGTTEELLFVQPLEINGARRARVALARAGRRVADATAQSEARSLIYRVKAAYYELARARAQRSLAADLLTTAQEFDRIARRQVELGSRAGIDTTQTGLEVARARQQVTITDADVRVAEIGFSALLGRNIETPPSELVALEYAPSSTDAETLLADALRSRPEIAQASAQGDAVRAEGNAIRAEGRPDISPLVRVGSLTRPQPNDSGNGFGVGIAISVPVFDYGSRRARLRQNDESFKAQQSEAVAVRQQVEQEVRQAFARLRAAETIVGTYRKGVLDQTAKLRDAARTGFREGQTSILQVLEAQRAYRSVQNDYLRALADAFTARAELERATAAYPLTDLEVKL